MLDNAGMRVKLRFISAPETEAPSVDPSLDGCMPGALRCLWRGTHDDNGRAFPDLCPGGARCCLVDHCRWRERWHWEGVDPF